MIVHPQEIGGDTGLYLDESLKYATYEQFSKNIYAAYIAVGNMEGMDVQIEDKIATLKTTDIWHGWHHASLAAVPPTSATSSYISFENVDVVKFKIKSSDFEPKEIKFLLESTMGVMGERTLDNTGATNIKDWTEISVSMKSFKGIKIKVAISIGVNGKDLGKILQIKEIGFLNNKGENANIIENIFWPKETGNNDPPEEEMPLGTKIKKNGIDLTLAWADEFIQKEELPDPTKWGYDVGDGVQENTDGTKGGVQDWGNGEAQWYTYDNPKNAFVSDGTLKIKALREEYKGKKWTSSRMVTRNVKEFKYGYFEFRAKIPETKGVWPAIWMLRGDINEGGLTWPDCGEIDIIETSTAVFGLDRVYGTLHCKAGYGGGPIYSQGLQMISLEKQWHLYALYWTENSMSWYYDDQLVGKYIPSDNKDNDVWPYKEDFYIIMNLAVGGTLGGAIPSDLNESIMELDYVRYFTGNGNGNEGDNGAGNPPMDVTLEFDYEVDPSIKKPIGFVANEKGAGKIDVVWGNDPSIGAELYVVYIDGKIVAISGIPRAMTVSVTTNGKHEFGVAAVKEGKVSEMTATTLDVTTVID